MAMLMFGFQMLMEMQRQQTSSTPLQSALAYCNSFTLLKSKMAAAVEILDLYN
jgi:hypothetical protein